MRLAMNSGKWLMLSVSRFVYPAIKESCLMCIETASFFAAWVQSIFDIFASGYEMRDPMLLYIRKKRCSKDIKTTAS